MAGTCKECTFSFLPVVSHKLFSFVRQGWFFCCVEYWHYNDINNIDYCYRERNKENQLFCCSFTYSFSRRQSSKLSYTRKQNNSNNNNHMNGELHNYERLTTTKNEKKKSYAPAIKNHRVEAGWFISFDLYFWYYEYVKIGANFVKNWFFVSITALSKFECKVVCTNATHIYDCGYLPHTTFLFLLINF